MDFPLIILTMKVAIVATLIDLPIALLAGWMLTKGRFPGRIVLDILISLPLALPPVAVGFFLLVVLGRTGVIGAVVYELVGIDLVFTWFAAAIASAVVSFPLVARAVVVAMGAVDENIERSARSLGAGPLRVALTVTIPLAYRGILAGVLLGFVRSLSEFGATIAVAGNIPGKTQTLSLAIYSSVQIRDDRTALYLVGISVTLAIATLAVHNWLLNRTDRRMSGG